MQEGNAALARRDYPAAEAAAREVLQGAARSPRAYDAQFLLAQALIGQRNYQAAAVAFDDTYNRSPQRARGREDSLLGLANALMGLNDRQASCAALDKLRAEFPKLRADVKTAARGRARPRRVQVAPQPAACWSGGAAPVSAAEFAAAMAPLGPFGAARRVARRGVGRRRTAWRSPCSLARWGAARAFIVDHGLRAGLRGGGGADGRRGSRPAASPPASCACTGSPPGPACRARARAARYAALEAACWRRASSDLLLGHQPATRRRRVLMRAARGQRAGGARRHGCGGGDGAIRLLRPLLGIPPGAPAQPRCARPGWPGSRTRPTATSASCGRACGAAIASRGAAARWTHAPPGRRGAGGARAGDRARSWPGAPRFPGRLRDPLARADRAGRALACAAAGRGRRALSAAAGRGRAAGCGAARGHARRGAAACRPGGSGRAGSCCASRRRSRPPVAGRRTARSGTAASACARRRRCRPAR